MNSRTKTGALAILAMAWIITGPAYADHPLSGRSLHIEAPELGSDSVLVLKSGRMPSLANTVPLPDPRLQETSLLVRWSGVMPGSSRRSERILLDASKWVGLGQPAGIRGWRYQDPEASRGGVRNLTLRQGPRGGTLRWTVRGENWLWPIQGPLASVDLALQIGDQRLCSAFRSDTARIRINSPQGRLSVREMPAPESCGEPICGNGQVEFPEQCDDGNLVSDDACRNDCREPGGDDSSDPADVPSQDPGGTSALHFESNRLYLAGPARADQSGRLEPTPGTHGRFDRLPLGPTVLAYEASDLSAPYQTNLGETALWIYLDGSTTNGIYAQARILFDFEDDGRIDREELFTAAPAHANRGLDLYDSSHFVRLSASGDYRDLNRGRIRLEFRNPLVPPREGPEIRTSAPLEEHAASHLQLPFIFSEEQLQIPATEPAVVNYPEEVLCPREGDDRCAPIAPPLDLTGEQRDAARQAGLESFRFRGRHGSCAGCHVPDGFDLAAIGYSDRDILRRAREHVSEQQAGEILRLIQIQREDHALSALLHPATFRPLQPGFIPLAGNTPRDRDLAFLRHLAEEQNLILLNDVIDSPEKARLAEQQLLALNVENLRIGVRLDRWSEDLFHGPSHIGQDPDDPGGQVGQQGSVAEWLPNLAVEPRPEQSEAFFDRFDQYAANPTDLAFWNFYDAIREDSVSHEALDTPARQRAFHWMQTKYESIQVLGHMLRRRTLDFPNTTIDQPAGLDEATLATAIARNPFWRVGDLIRQHPLNCNHPDGCTRFPDFVPVVSGQREQNLQSRYLQRAWFWAGWMIDDALLLSDDNFATISGDYFYPLHHGVWNGHYAFITARMSVMKANVEQRIRPWHHARAGHGKWASIRPFLVFKHSEFQRPMVSPADPRYFWNQRIMSNLARMWLYAVHDDLQRTGSAFDREGTAKAMNFIRRNWIESVDPGGDRSDTDRLYAEIIEMLRGATELREQHHTEDLYDYLPVEDVALD
jgi:cysteine-rich repeat protein